VDAQRKAKSTIYVHCFGGVSREGMVVTAYEMQKNKRTRDQALEFVRTKRPIVRPNLSFMTLLLEWEAVVKKSAPAKP
jgi:protein-tyrosine phosphatase